MVTETAATGRESDKFMLRLPDGMRDRLKELAKSNNRTLNAEIVARLEQSLMIKDDLSANSNRAWMAMLAMSIRYVGACASAFENDVPEIVNELKSAQQLVQSIHLSIEAVDRSNPFADDFTDAKKQLESLAEILQKFKEMGDPEPPSTTITDRLAQHFKDGEKAAKEGGILKAVKKAWDTGLGPSPKPTTSSKKPK